MPSPPQTWPAASLAARGGDPEPPTAAEFPPLLDPSPDQILAAAQAWVGDPGLQATDLTGEDREAMATLLKAPNRYVGLCRLQGIEPDDPAPGPREGPGRWEFAGEQYRQAGAARDAAAETSHPDDQDAAAVRSADRAPRPAEPAPEPARLLVDDGGAELARRIGWAPE